MSLNGSSFLAGCFMIIMNIGSKYVVLDIPIGMQHFFSHPYMRKLTIFCIAYIATRNIKTSFLILLLFIMMSKFIMNEKSKCCIPSLKKYKK